VVDFVFCLSLLRQRFTTSVGFVEPFPALRLFDAHSSDSCGDLFCFASLQLSVYSVSALSTPILLSC